MYVTHHLEEMFEIGDRVTILRDGGLVTCKPMAEFDHDSLIASMVGRKIESLYPASKRTIGEPRLHGPRPAAGRARRRRSTSRCAPARSSASRACSAPGRSELLRAIFGADPVEAGHIEVDGKQVRPGDPRRAVQAGIGPADRGPQAARAAARAVDPRERLAGAPRRDLALLDRRQAAASAGSSTSTSAACACAPARGSSRCRRCRAATSRRCCSPAGWRPRPRCSCSTSRPRASTSGPRPRSTRSSATSRPKGSAWSSCRPTCPRCSGWPTACWSCARARWRASCPRRGRRRRTCCTWPARAAARQRATRRHGITRRQTCHP